ncbi:hypothetical protein ACFSWE_02170 [Leucobacter albus]|uniref:LPXTG-motif cell wall-anchored protein n=1 Tax=Leucobacter albus TaxID=272210 RepID=A0ABW3TLR6_9MICO
MTTKQRHGALRAALIVVVTAVLPFAGQASGAHAAGLLEPSNTAVAFDTPAPGHSTEWTMAAENTSGGTVGLSIEIAEVSGTATAGDAPLRLTIEDAAGALLAEGAASALVGESFDLPDLAAGETVRLRAAVTLPFAAGDDYRGSTASIRVDFIATGDSAQLPGVPPGPGLSATGSVAPLALACVALALLSGGIVLTVRRRNRTEEPRA